MKSKVKILIFIDWYYPAYQAGGPIRSVANIINALADEFDFYLITSAYDLNETNCLPNILPNEWVKKEQFQLIYLDRQHQTPKFFKNLIESIKPDFYYFNSLFSFKFTLTPLFLVPDRSKVILAPRGMLGEEALKIKKAKKILFIQFLKHSKFLKNIRWHASTQLEKNEIIKAFGKKSRITIAQNIAMRALNRPPETLAKKRGELHLIFFSRINEKKNLKFAIEVLEKINDNNIKLDVYGPVESRNYFDECFSLVTSKQLNVNYRGILKPTDLPAKLWNYHYLFFPTKHENFGHVITESFCASLPVILSQNTPWLSLEKKNVGYDLPLKLNDFINKLAELKSQTHEEYKEISQATFKFAHEHILNDSIIEDNRKMFTHE